MNLNWITKAAQKLRNKEEAQRERDRIQYTRYIRTVAGANHFWMRLGDIIKADAAIIDLNTRLTLTVDINKINRIELQSPRSKVYVKFNEIIPMVEVLLSASREVQAFYRFRLHEDDGSVVLILDGQPTGTYQEIGVARASEIILKMLIDETT